MDNISNGRIKEIIEHNTLCEKQYKKDLKERDLLIHDSHKIGGRRMDDETKERLWWRDYQKNIERKLMPKNKIKKWLFYTPTSESRKRLEEETFILGVAHGRNIELDKRVKDWDKLIKKMKLNTKKPPIKS